MSKNILITGATAGIGKACAEKFAEEGNCLIITGRRLDRLKILKASLEKKGNVKVIMACFDVQDKEAVFAAAAEIEKVVTQIDILINNAGLALGKDAFDKAAIEDWDIMLQTNVNGVLYVSRAFLPLIKKSSQPQIINIGSTAAKEVYENGAVYCASKSAVEAISKGMRIDLLPLGIKVTALHPGAAETEFSMVRFKNDEQKAKDTYKGFTPLTAKDIADTAYYCCQLPKHVCINDLVITSTQQANSNYIYKK